MSIQGVGVALSGVCGFSSGQHWGLLLASGGQEKQLCMWGLTIDIPEPLHSILGLTLHWSRCRATRLPMMEFPWPFYGVRVGSRVSVEHQTESRECLSSGRCYGAAGRVDTT